MHNTSAADDTETMNSWLASPPDTEGVAGFVPGPGIQKIDLTFDIDKLRAALTQTLGIASYQGADDFPDEGFNAIPLTRRPGMTSESTNDLSGRYYIRPDETYDEVPREDFVDEGAFSEFVSELRGTYFEEVHRELTDRFPIGRMRVLMKDPMTCNSWHRDPEPRLHIPIVTNPGAVMIVNHHCTHLPADGSVYFTDTRGYHSALNGGEKPRVHIVAALPQ